MADSPLLGPNDAARPPSVVCLWRHARERPDEIAVQDERVALSFERLCVEIDGLAETFRAGGIGAGSPVLFLPDVCVEAVVAYWALRAIDAVVVVGDPAASEADRIAYVARVDITHALVGRRAAETAPMPPSVFCFSLAPSGDGLRPWEADTGQPPVPSDARAEDATARPAVILFSSGTTGQPKAIVHTAQTIAALHETLKLRWKLSPGDRVLGALPFHTIYGLLFSAGSALYVGASLILMARFRPRPALQTIERHRVTTAAFVPTMALMIFDLDDRAAYDLSSLRAVYTASAPISDEDIARFTASCGVALISNYGMTEIPGAAVEPADAPHRPGSVGQICPGFEAVARNENGEPLPPGESGEITLRGPTLMRGYLDQPDLTAERIRGGWIYTQDIGSVDTDGHIYLSGRRSDMIIRGGLNISPLEIEAVLSQHDAVLEAAVIGMPDRLFGQVPTACVVLRAGAETAAAEEGLAEHCAAHLPPPKRPAAYHVVDALPRNAGGKVLRKALSQFVEDAQAHRDDGRAGKAGRQ